MGSLREIKDRIGSVRSTLKIDQAQYTELEAFSKFSSDMDKVTAMTLDKGRKNNQLLIQAQYAPMPVGEQIAILYCGTHALMADISIDQVRQFQPLFLDRMRSTHEDVLAELASGKISEEAVSAIESEAASICLQLKNS